MEEWRTIPSCPGYEASSLGRVRRVTQGKGTRHRTTGGYLKLTEAKTGYLMVYPFFEGKRESVHVHTLVAEAFIGPCPFGFEVHHRDSNRHNNIDTNLEYVKMCEHRSFKGINNPISKLSEEDVVSIREEYKKGGISHAKIAKKYGVCSAAISHIIARRNWRHIP